MKDISWIGDLKFRVSYGYTGNQENLPPNKYQLLYAPAGPYLYNGQIYQSYAVNQEYNPDLKWEVRKSFNIGLDFSLFDDRINGSVDVFNDETSDMLYLYNIPQPPFLTNNVYANAATAVNKGVEITIGAAAIKNRNFSWNIQANLATLDNHITKLLGEFKGVPLTLSNSGYGTVSGAFGSAYVTQLVVGYPTGVFWLPQHAGLDAGGNELFNNYDVSGKLIGTSTTFTDDDRRYINPSPQFTWGITNSFRYKNIDLSFFFRGVQGQKIYSNTLMNVDVSKNLPGANVREPALSNGFTNYPVPSTYWLQNGSFARLDNLTIGYSFQKIKGISKLRLYLTGTNLFVVTSYQGIDPEVRTEGNFRYIDANYYPKTRGFIFGVNLVF
jgi:iron complex outermembrane receptor protein